jgi:predicted ABC-type ATPase
MFAGPNGSGKSTLYRRMRELGAFSSGLYQNADEIEKTLNDTGRINFREWGLSVTEKMWLDFVRGPSFARELPSLPITVKDNSMIVNGNLSNSYFSSILCDFMRYHWIESGTSFIFETVMSHPGKVELLESARAKGFRTYLYFVCTGAPEINQRRVKARVKEGGHDVQSEKIASRYHRTLSLLADAIRHSDRAFLFDNSDDDLRLVVEFENAAIIKRVDRPPDWCVQHALRKI